ncbi:hypothetical protein ACUN7V_03255 [Quadrisphaera oryzae]|uniref:hypothetical protein n=1 Tax=Quadrisphaera TaxID=317661 RepID=UPI002106E688|nr:hypothetical protein [Quadrisphaera sp. RL12-1S]
MGLQARLELDDQRRAFVADLAQLGSDAGDDPPEGQLCAYRGHDEWAAGDGRYLFEASMAALNGTNITELRASLTTGDISIDISIDTGAAMTA